MASDDDEEELAMLRAQRAAKTGAPMAPGSKEDSQRECPRMPVPASQPAPGSMKDSQREGPSMPVPASQPAPGSKEDSQRECPSMPVPASQPAPGSKEDSQREGPSMPVPASQPAPGSKEDSQREGPSMPVPASQPAPGSKEDSQRECPSMPVPASQPVLNEYSMPLTCTGPRQQGGQPEGMSKHALYLQANLPPGSKEDSQREGPSLPVPSSRPMLNEYDNEDEDSPVVVGDGSDNEQDEAELTHGGLRGHFPLSFGEQETTVAKPADIYDKHKRESSKSFGPPRPPGAEAPKPAAGGGASFGPPRPPGKSTASFGPPRPPSAVQVDPDVLESQRKMALAAGVDLEEDEDGGEGMVGPPRPPGSDGEEEAGGYLDEADGEDPWHLPITHEATLGGHAKAVVCMDVEHSGSRIATLGGHAKAVVCMDVEHSGSRIVTGSLDYTIRIYDFNGMKSDLRAFREVEPQDGNPVLSVSWSPSGECFLVVTGSAQAKIYDRDGKSQGEFIRGDMYIRDQKNTKGHISGCTSGQWHPKDRNTVMTSSDDGTVRLWDAENMVQFGTSAAVGQVLPPSQQMLEKQKWTVVSRPSHIARPAHEAGTEITCLNFSRDGNTLVSRGMDSTLKLWDIRRFTKPMAVFNDLPCAQPMTSVIFSPDEQLLAKATVSAQGGLSNKKPVALASKSEPDLRMVSAMYGLESIRVWLLSSGHLL
eukprot:gene4303-14413_t